VSVVTRPGDAIEAFDVADAKRVLRARMRAVRRVIASDADQRHARSELIANRLVQLIEARPPVPRRAMTYDALPGEVDLAVFHEWCRTRGIERFSPFVDPDHRDALLVVPGPLDPGDLDVVVVPGVAFTMRGHRLGQGGGHFDRFLPRLRAGCLRVGVCFREQLVDEVPSEPHDVVLDAVVSDADPAPDGRWA
jgi:5-formyltetrahydrofolate cyclo-ligase